MPSTITANDLLAKMKINIDVWVSPDFNGNLDGTAEHDERGGETYAIWVHDSEEANEHLKISVQAIFPGRDYRRLRCENACYWECSNFSIHASIMT